MKTFISGIILSLFLAAMPVSLTSKNAVFSASEGDFVIPERLPFTTSQVVGTVKIKVGATLRRLRKGDRIESMNQIRFSRKENKILVQDVNRDCFWILSTTGGTGACIDVCKLKLEQYKGNCAPN